MDHLNLGNIELKSTPKALSDKRIRTTILDAVNSLGIKPDEHARKVISELSFHLANRN